jgi:uncharacterized membrane protein
MLEPSKSSKDLTTLVYVLQALSFVFGVTLIAAVMINYIKQDAVRGTWLESHFRWQIRTFWFSLLWFGIGGLTSFILIGYVILALNGLWLLYRILRGFICLRENRPMYISSL